MLTDWMLRLRSLVKRDAVEQELDDELRFHFEHLVESHIGKGLARDEAVRRARIELGGFEQIKEQHRDARGIRLVDDLGRDLRYAFRQFRRAPGFAAVAVLCLGLGIGVNTSIFGVINAVMLRPMPVAGPDRLVYVGRAAGPGWSYPDYRDVKARTHALSGLAVTIPMESDLDADGESSFVVAEAGLRRLRGRARARIISGTLVRERSRTGGRHQPRDLGAPLPSQPGRGGPAHSIRSRVVHDRRHRAAQYTGVSAPMRTDLWVPIQTRPRLAAQLEEGGFRSSMKLFGRLGDGATAAQAAAELNAIDGQLGRSPGIESPIVAEEVHAMPDPGLRRRVAVLTTLLAAVVALVLLIACVNVGNLLLVRGALRQREFAVRRALGASRLRLLRQLLAESLVLAACGGICGLVLAVWANGLLEKSVPPFLGAFAFQLDSRSTGTPLSLPRSSRLRPRSSVVCSRRGAPPGPAAS